MLVNFLCWGGLIPARAGNTSGGFGVDCGDGAHPRSRGEHCQFSGILRREAGSSPLARGTHCQPLNLIVSVGLIPARAGNTSRLRLLAVRGGAHPRSRGEHRAHGHLPSGCRGSSPLARGTPSTYPTDPDVTGLIPARAGNTRGSLQVQYAKWAHPRSRGEHLIDQNKMTEWGGSSPLARGTRFGCFVVGCVGGSSPLARGTPVARVVHIYFTGLIPARAGNTQSRMYRNSWMRAHPRSRGEHANLSTFWLVDLGSSPLARGTRQGYTPPPTEEGLIPARAGNTARFACQGQF